jgi:hypothetical protein
MANIIPAVQGSNIQHCLLIDIAVNDTTYYISNAYSPLVFQGNTYTQLGYLLAMSEIQDDLKSTNNQISITLSGIPPVPDSGDQNYMSIALNSNLKGSRIRIWRAFFQPDPGVFVPNQVYLRFNGYINNYGLNENWDQDNQTTSNSISIQCSSINAILEKSYGGRRTNESDQTLWYPGDRGMFRVKSLSDTQFDFGKPV